MGKIILKLAIISFVTCLLSIIFIVFLYSNSNDLEYKVMEIEPGWHFHKFIGIVPESYKKQFSIIINQKNENFTLFEIVNVDGDEYRYYYIRFKNKNEGFLKGSTGDPRNENYLCTGINIQLFNEYINSNGIINEDSVKTKYINLFRNPKDYQSLARIESISQMKYFLEGTPLRKNNSMDTIDLENLKISFDKELVCWIRYRGFFKLKFNFKDGHLLNTVECERIGWLDPRLLDL